MRSISQAVGTLVQNLTSAALTRARHAQADAIMREASATFLIGNMLSTQECMITFSPCYAQPVFNRPHAHAQVPSHWSPSVERIRIHVKGMVRSTGWLDSFSEVGRRRGPWRRRWAKDLLDASTEGENNSVRHGATCQRLCKNRNRAATQPSLSTGDWKYCDPAPTCRSWRRARTSARHDPLCRYRPVH
jgi:hypothetical protein